MEVTLTKHHGLGNDFLVYDIAQGVPTAQWPELAQRWCDRRMVCWCWNDTVIGARQ